MKSFRSNVELHSTFLSVLRGLKSSWNRPVILRSFALFGLRSCHLLDALWTPKLEFFWTIDFHKTTKIQNIFLIYLLTAIWLTLTQYTFTHNQYTEQYNETEYPERKIHNNKNSQTTIKILFTKLNKSTQTYNQIHNDKKTPQNIIFT
jgi:hypothetical protein